MATVPSIRLIVPTPDVSASTAYMDPDSTSVSMSIPKKKSRCSPARAAAAATHTVRGGGDFSDIVRRVGGGESITGRGWEVRVDGSDAGSVRSRREGGTWGMGTTGEYEGGEGEGMVLIRKKVKTRGRVDAVFGDVTNANARPATPVGTESGRESRQEGAKDKWWNLTRGRKDTAKEGGVLGFLLAPRPPSHPRRPSPSPTRLWHPFPAPPQRRFNSLGASSALAPAPHQQAQVRPTEYQYQRSVSAGSQVLLNQQQQQPRAAPSHYAHLPGASAPYATLTRVERYQQPASAAQVPPRSPPPPSQQQPTQRRDDKPIEFKRSASAMAFHDDKPAEFKRSASALGVGVNVGSALVGSGILLGAPASTLGRVPTPTPLSRAPTPVPGPRSGTPTTGLLAPPHAGVGVKDKDKEGSIAVRAMRSVRSMARLWDGEDTTHNKGGAEKEGGKENGNGEGGGEGTVRGKKVKVKVKVKEEGKEKKDKQTEKEKKPRTRTRARRNASRNPPGAASSASGVSWVLGWGRRRARRSARARQSARGRHWVLGGAPSALSLGRVNGGKAKHELEPAPGVRASSATGSSGAGSRVSSGSSVRWAEEVVDRVRGMGRGREERRREKGGRRRGSKGEPEVVGGPQAHAVERCVSGVVERSSASGAESVVGPPMLTVEEATTDGHGHGRTDTPDAATNDLAQLITHLNLEGTPATPSPGAAGSPTGRGKTLRPSDGSVSSLRPYAAQGKSTQQAMLGQQIAPWPSASPPSAPPEAGTGTATFKRLHRRTMTPTPEPEPAPVFHPLRLRPSRIRPPLAHHAVDMRAPSSLTFGSRSSSGSVEDRAGLPPVFMRGHARNRSSLLPDAAASPKSSQGSTMPLARETKRVLGMGGTMGGSDASGYNAQQELDASDPDSDIPDDLGVLLSASGGQSPVDDTLSFRPPSPPLPSPGLPPFAPLPAIEAPPQIQLPVLNIELIGGDGDEGGLSSSEEDTKKSFDWTGELRNLNESGGSDRLSFVEQLENAFATPAKLDLRGLLSVDVPPVPAMPVTFEVDKSTSSSEQSSSGFEIPHSVSRLIDMKELTMGVSSDSDHSVDVASRIVDQKEPTLLPGSDSLCSDDSLLPPRPFAPGRSDGQLNVKFKFGGELPGEEEEKPKPRKNPLTLSDIIPPPSHVRSQSLSSLMEEDDSVLKSILAHAEDLPRPRARVNSDSSARRVALENSRASMMSMHSRPRSSRPPSGISFTGFDSFEEVRRGFEFHNNRPAFYPPPVASNKRVPHGRQDSVFSIASVSSYGHVTNPGITDPFEYGLPMPSLRERPSSEDLSMSMSLNVDDTFSDASSFYFKAPTQPSVPGHRRRESNMSVSSQNPPISFYNYNRSFGNQRLSENDTSTSGSSLAHQYAAYGATGGRQAWAKHRQQSSVDSVMSDYSVSRLGRPGVGDKMFDTVMDHGHSLRAISASPPESRGSELRNRSSYDSIIDEERRSSMEDSLFEKTGHRSSMSSDSVFGYDDHNPPMAFAAAASVPFHNSVHSPMKEDDTMISMLGGGDHIRRRSIGSVFEASPCVRVEKRKHTAFQDDDKVPNKARIVTQPSIASTSSSKFGGERMVRARQGLLVRQSLEETALVAEGEDLTSFRPAAVFTRPSPNSRSRSSTITTSSSGADTPPLSPAEGSSMSEGSQSSIDMSQVNIMLANTTHPMSNLNARTRARGRGHHRRRYSAAPTRASRSSVYETIQEERASPATVGSKLSSSPTACQGVFIVDPDAGSVDMSADSPGWDDERGIVALRRYYALRHEAEDTVTETFSPPKNPESMQALLQHSVQNYGPLPSELGPRRVRSRTQSRASPYPTRQAQSTTSPEQAQRPSPADLHRAFITSNALQAMEVNPNVDMSPTTVLSPKRENTWGPRPRVASAARRSALGWAKRSTKENQKENNTSMTGMSFTMTPGESLRINRPRPRGRPTPARAAAATPRLVAAAV
ncbi:hypothetical protein B0H12DRAFT_1204744 [Mycena haematopus]|nr:hypothetical protein B0H12DRAFT_1204744 [Mycena haematopus]